MARLRYFQFISKMFFKKWTIWLFVGLYFVIFGLFLYLLPNVANQAYFQTYTFKIFLGLLVASLMLVSLTTVLTIFKNQMDDGTDLLIVTRPISRSTIIWTKILYLVCFILVISSLSCIITIPAKYSVYNYYDNYESILLGSFLGCLINMMLWSSLTLLLSILFTKMQVSIFVIMLQFVLFFLTIITVMVCEYPIRKFNKDKMYIDGVSLISDIDENSKTFNYRWGSIAGEYGKGPITPSTKWKGLPIKHWVSDLSNFNHLYLDSVYSQDNLNYLKYFDLNGQLASLFSYYSANWLKEFNVSANLDQFIWEPFVSSYFHLKPTTINIQTVANEIGAKTYSFPKIDQEYYLVANPYTVIQEKNKNSRIGTDSTFNQKSGTYTLDVNFQEITLPVPEYDVNNQNWKLRTFKSIKEFGEYWFMDVAEQQIQFHNYYWKACPTWIEGDPSYLPMVIASTYIYQMNNLTHSSSEYEIINNFLIPFRNWEIQFQMWSFQFFKYFIDHPNEFKNFNDSNMRALMEALNHWDWSTNKTYSLKRFWRVYLGTPQEFIELSKNRSNLQLQNYWRKVNYQFGLVPKEWLSTYSEMSIQPIYSSGGLLAGWLTLSALLFVGSTILYTKRDFK